MMRLGLLRDGFETKAIEAFGVNIARSSGEPYAPLEGKKMILYMCNPTGYIAG